MGLLQLRRAVTEKLQRPNPGIFFKHFSFLVSQRKDCYGRSTSNKEQAGNKIGSLRFVYYMHIKPRPPHSRLSHSGSLLFLGHTVNSSPSMHWYLPFPWSRVSLSSSHGIHCNTPHLVPKIILIAWTSKHEFSTFLLSPRIIFKDSFSLGRYNLVSILTQYSILVLKTWWATHKNPEGTLHLLSAATLN